MTRRRTEAEVIADTIVVLMHEGHLQSSDVYTLRKLFSLTPDDINNAGRRLDENGGKRPATAGRDDVIMTPPRPKRSPETSRWNVQKQRQEFRCSGARVHPPHWAPEGAFTERSDRPGKLHAACDEARAQYQRQRTVAARAMPWVNLLGIELDVDADSVVIGLKCATCKTAITEGDTIKMNGHPHHSTCLSEVLG